MARRPCAKPCARPSKTPRSSSAVKSTRLATSSSISTIGSGPGRKRSCAARIQSADVKTAQRLLLDLAKRLETKHPSAAETVREGLDDTLTVLTLNLSARLRRSLATTNAAESLLSRTRHVKRNVKRWRGGQMMLRWVAAGVLEAVKGFRRLNGYADMPTLIAALRTRDRQLGLSVAQEERQIA
jgi:hypothetical protein